MKKQLLLFIIMFTAVWAVQSQQIVADWETPETSQAGNGSWPAGGTMTIIDNPYVAAPNESSKVFEYCKADPAWAGMGLVFRDPAGEPKTGFNVDEDVAQLCMMIRADHNFAMKVTVADGRDANDESVRIPPPWDPTSTDSVDAQISLTEYYTAAGEWQELCFDYKNHSAAVASVVEYATIALSPQEAGTNCYQIDNITKLPETTSGGTTEVKTGAVLWDMESTIPIATKSWSNGGYGSDTFGIVDNPLVEGNTSSKVWKWCKGAGAGKYAAMNFAEGLDFTGTSYTICMDVLMPHNGEVGLKINDAIVDGDTITSLDITDLIEPYTGNGAWQQVCFNGQQGDRHGEKVAGFKFASFNIYMDINNVPEEDGCHFFDNITLVDGPIDIISDWETVETSNEGGAYGNPYEEGVVENPHPDAANSTANTYHMCKNADSNAWAGFGVKFVTDTTFDVTGDVATLCLSMYADVQSKVMVKLLGATDGSADFGWMQDYTDAGNWQVMCWDFANSEALGHIYTGMVVQPDNTNVPASETCFYVDEIKKRTNGTGVLLELANDIISKSADHSMLAGFIESADISDAINAQGISVFAPTNAAFNALPSSTLDILNNNTDGALYNLLFHHITHDSLGPDDLSGVHIMRNGQDGTFDGAAINGATVTESTLAKNGFVHFVDAVMTFPVDPDQYDLIGFEGDDEPNTRDWWYWETAGNVAIDYVANPSPEGINTSANVLQYKKFPVGKWYQGLAVLPKRVFNFFGPMTKVCMDVKTDHDGEVFLKYGKSMGAGAKTGWRSNFSGGDWNTVCWEATNPNWYNEDETGVNLLNDGMALFFDSENKEFPADTVLFYIDNIRTVNRELGTNNIDKLENFSMFPNPVNDMLMIKSDTPIHHIEIYDIAGRIVNTTIDPLNTQINVSSLMGGVYLVDLYSDNNQRIGTAKFVKK